MGISVSTHRKSGNKLAGLGDTDTCQESFLCLVKVVLGTWVPVHVAVCMYNVCTHVMTVYLIAVETKMYLEMLFNDQAQTKQEPSMDQARTKEKWENFGLSVGLTVDTWKLLCRE